jgi:hypothetical protein
MLHNKKYYQNQSKVFFVILIHTHTFHTDTHFFTHTHFLLTHTHTHTHKHTNFTHARTHSPSPIHQPTQNRSKVFFLILGRQLTKPVHNKLVRLALEHVSDPG